MSDKRCVTHQSQSLAKNNGNHITFLTTSLEQMEEEVFEDDKTEELQLHTLHVTQLLSKSSSRYYCWSEWTLEEMVEETDILKPKRKSLQTIDLTVVGHVSRKSVDMHWMQH